MVYRQLILVRWSSESDSSSNLQAGLSDLPERGGSHTAVPVFVSMTDSLG